MNELEDEEYSDNTSESDCLSMKRIFGWLRLCAVTRN
jgi:hypothetical protein